MMAVCVSSVVLCHEPPFLTGATVGCVMLIVPCWVAPLATRPALRPAGKGRMDSCNFAEVRTPTVSCSLRSDWEA